jgi:DNA-binding transcriptional regulator YhcF (GntR family)
LESFSREELIELVRKQMGMTIEARKQLEASQKETKESQHKVKELTAEMAKLNAEYQKLLEVC